jgi:hypothetical protein
MSYQLDERSGTRLGSVKKSLERKFLTVHPINTGMCEFVSAFCDLITTGSARDPPIVFGIGLASPIG